MPQIVTYSKLDNLIHVKSTGHVSAKEVKSSILEIAKIRQEIKLTNVLVDHLDVTSLPSNVDAFNLGSDVAHLLKNMNLAIVRSSEIKDDTVLLEKSARIRGANMRVFDNTEAARKWIKNQQI